MSDEKTAATYKSGEAAQVNDEVMGVIDGQPARGRVLAVRDNGNVLVTRRAPYSGPGKPLAAIHEEAPAAGLTLVYRPVRRVEPPATKRLVKKDAKAAPAPGGAKK